MSDPQLGRYSHLIFRFHLPFRLFLDEGVYFVHADGVPWRLTLKDLPQTRIESTNPPIDFGDRAQLRLDNHGFSGITEVTSGHPFSPYLTKADIHSLQCSQQAITLRDAIAPLNRLIALYRTKTREFWFRPIGEKDIPAFSSFMVNVDSNSVEPCSLCAHTAIVSGVVFLKTEEWYHDLLHRLALPERLPIFYDYWHEAQDALERDNLRLAASLIPLAVEDLARQLLLAYWPNEDVTRRADQMLSTYFRRFRDIGDPSALPLSKKEALRLFEKIWRQRDLLLHGHDIELTRGEVAEITAAFGTLAALWEHRPGAVPLRIEGPFVQFGSPSFPVQSAEAMLRRAASRLNSNHLRDAAEAAHFALGLDKENVGAHLIAGECAMRAGDYEAAIPHFEFVVALVPDFEPALHNLSRARKLAAQGPRPASAQ